MLYRFIVFLFAFLCLTVSAAFSQQPVPYTEISPPIRLNAKLNRQPDIPSPYTTPDSTETVTIRLKDGSWSVVPVMVENGEPYCPHCQSWGKGRQLVIDYPDFPTLRTTGLHSEDCLDRKEMITGRSIELINYVAKPNRFSGSGFIAEDEDIISVLKGDNRLVAALGLTHPQMARVLFHVWNLDKSAIDYILYNGKKIQIKAEGDKGYQESIFHDEITGHWRMEIWRDLEPEEERILQKNYAGLAPDQWSNLIKKLTGFHTGEMVPFYVMRYGFYEGHTGFRADPIAVAFIFGLRRLEEIEAAFPGQLYEKLTEHFVTK